MSEKLPGFFVLTFIESQRVETL